MIEVKPLSISTLEDIYHTLPNCMRRTKPIPNDAIRVGRSSTGLGLFAVTPLSPGMYIEYVGEIISEEEALARKKNKYLFEISKKWTIDGANRSNKARYINHSCIPNCESLLSGKRVFIKVIKHVLQGEELTYDYGTEYVDEFIKPNGCRCRKCL